MGRSLGSETAASVSATALDAGGARRLDWTAGLVAALRRPAGMLTHLAAAVLLVAILTIGMRTGIVPIRSYVEDLIFFADNAWRVLWGQRPYIDYSSGLGPVTYFISALGLKLAGGNLNGLGYGNVLAGTAIGAWAYILLRRRVSGLLAVAGSVMLCLLALAPVELGESFRLSTIAMSYNRQGYAMLGLLIIEAFPLREGSPARSFGGAFSTGALCAILLFLKANYFLVGLVLAGVSLVWTGRLERRRLAGLAAGFAVAFLPFAAYFGFRLSPMLADLRMAADARSGAVSPAFVAQVFAENFPALLILAGLAALAQSAGGRAAGSGLLEAVRRYRVWALLVMIYGAGVLVLVTNAQLERLPMQELMALLLLDVLLQTGGLDARHAIALCAVGAGLILGPQSADELALANGLRLKLHTPREYAYRVTDGGFTGAVFLDDYRENKGTHRAYGNFFASYLNDGLGLLRRELHAGEKVATMDTYNGFPFALGIEPPHGGMASATYKYLYSDRYHPTPDAFFGNADVVMFPKEHALEDAKWEGLMIYYYPEMQKRFVQVAESSMWKMYRRRQ